MLRPNAWTVGLAALVLTLGASLSPEARTPSRDLLSAAPLAPSASMEIGGCTTVDQRETYERKECLQVVRLGLIEGNLDLAEALRRLESCAAIREDLADLARTAAAARADLTDARIAFGDSLADEERAAHLALVTSVDRPPAWIPTASLRRLQAAGIDSGGLDLNRSNRILERLATEATLRADFRTVFGDSPADALEAILARDTTGPARAVIVGETVIVPNLPAVQPGPDGSLVAASSASVGPLVVGIDAYSARLAIDLRTLEAARQRYLDSAARRNQRAGSVRTFFASLRRLGEADDAGQALSEEVAHDRAVVAAVLLNLDRRLGVDPLLARMAGESVGLVTEIDRRCQAVATGRRQWIHRGAGVVGGLVGAAGLVVATGYTGTMIGGITIAAAIEASLGAYLIARSERIATAIPTSARVTRGLTDDPELRRFRRPEGETELEVGSAGGGGGEHELWFEDFGESHEFAFLEGEGIEEEGDDTTEQGPKENTIPPILPVAMPDALRELPPILDTFSLRQMRDLSLPEIQERLDEFLARSDPTAWARLVEEQDVSLWSAQRLIQEAQTALDLWERERVLSDRFGAFFVQAELERAAPARRNELLMRAMGRYLHDREIYSTSADVDDLRQRLANRLVTHCRGGTAAGDLALTACTDETALSTIVIAALQDAGLDAPDGSVLGVRATGQRLEAVLYFAGANQVYSLTRGDVGEGVVAPIYHPAVYYYTYLIGHGVVPKIDVDRHLLIALPDRPMPPELEAEECVPGQQQGVVGRALGWVGSMFGIRRVASDDPCAPSGGPRARQANRGGERTIGLRVPTPRNPLQRGGGGQSGGGGGGGGGGGASQPLAGNAPGDPLSSGSSGQQPENGGGASGSSGRGNDGSAAGSGDAAGSGGAGDPQAGAAGAGDATDSARTSGSGGTAAAAAPGAAGNGASDDGSSTAGSGGSGGYGVANVGLPPAPNLTGVGRETVRTSQTYQSAGALRVTPWRLREDEGMATGSASGVLYADNSRALERFDEDDLFITLAPAEVEVQRRMLEADNFPIYQAETDCDSPNLPPRRVFRRAATGDPGFRYVYCDQNEAMVIFRSKQDADSYAALSAPDRPLYLARLASERLARFERSAEVRRLTAYLDDPNVVRRFSKDEINATVKAAADLLVFQDALESALVQSMNELGPSGIRSYYYEMHRQVLQAPFFIRIAEGVYRLNQRLASDPLQSLAWANAQDRLARQGFFDLYFTVGGMMEWPERWATLERRYGNAAGPPAEVPAQSLDFLQILSDPTRVRIDWAAERSGDPSIRDRQMQDGVERTHEDRAEPTLADQLARQDEKEHQRGGTGGLGRAGEGESLGPERGQRPLQMIHIRIAPDTGDPDRQRLPDDNQIRPGGTEGRERRQTEESASRQEPVLWVTPQTFVEAVLSTWDSRDLRPETADRIPPLLRFSERLRDVFLREFQPVQGVYDNRLRAAMEVFTRGGWLRFAEVRDAMGGSLASVRASDTGRFSGAYSGNAPINDQDQLRIPNFFSASGVLIPGDLFDPLSRHFSRTVLESFQLSRDGRIPPASSLAAVPVAPGESAARARSNVLRALQLVDTQAEEAN